MLIYIHTDNLGVISYSEVDFVACMDSRNSILGYVFMLANGVVSWRSMKQTCIDHYFHYGGRICILF